MVQTAINVSFQLIAETCINCGIIFGIPNEWRDKRVQDHRNMFCPNGHQQHYPAETDLEKERRKSAMLADQVRMEREQREKAERKLKRISRGVCPECNRSFANVERHMKSKHKEHK